MLSRLSLECGLIPLSYLCKIHLVRIKCILEVFNNCQVLRPLICIIRIEKYTDPDPPLEPLTMEPFFLPFIILGAGKIEVTTKAGLRFFFGLFVDSSFKFTLVHSFSFFVIFLS